jgi:polyisoprenoid-binding protein YceI
MKILLIASALLLAVSTSFTQAADYVVDTKGAHASINFKVQHLGYSWLIGRFDKFSGSFSYDSKNVSDSKIEMTIDTTSINSNHAARDKHLKSADFLEVSEFGEAKFVSSSVSELADGEIQIKGMLTLHGVSKDIVIMATKIGEGPDPWKGYRVGFSGTTTITMKDFDMNKNLGPASTQVQLELHIEGIKVKK